jgi:diguanylate cyclase (GGDEF)-like protein
MATIREQLLEIFEQYADDDTHLIEKLQALTKEEGRDVYTLIFQILTNLDLSPATAEKYWHEIISHSKTLSGAMGRAVNLRTVICDYFCSINKSLHNPKIIEIPTFEKTTRSLTLDSLTGLLNRNTFDEALKRETSRAKRHDSNLTLLFLDLDNFKHINDTLGHLAGDEVLRKVAQLIMAEKRSEDIAARYGGEEITILLPETNKADGWLIGERIRKTIEEAEIYFEGNIIKITLSGGLASFPIDANDDLTLLKHADLAMYRAKSFGKNNISFYSMDKRRNVRIEYSTSVEIQELGIHNKPVFSATTRSLSISGILVESNEHLDEGAKIQLNMSLNEADPLLIVGTVVRSKKIDSENHEISIAFLDSVKVMRNEISSYLLKHLKDLSSLRLDAAQSPT